MKLKVERDYADIEAVLLDFSKSYNALKALRNDLTSCLHGRIPVIGEDDSALEAVRVTDDADFVSRLAETEKVHNPVDTLVIYCSIMEQLLSSINKAQRLSAKMDARLKGSGSSSGEASSAASFRAKYNADIKIYQQRFADILTRFCKVRRGLVLRLSAMSETVAMMMASGSAGKDLEQIVARFAIHRKDTAPMEID